MLETGAVLAGYRVEGVLGQGAMGEVYRVRHVDRGTMHAMKYLPLPARKVRQRILREAQAQTRMSHPNVVSLFEVVEIDGDPALIMELVDGPSLDKWLETARPTMPEAEAMFRQIVAGVNHAHRKGLVHRDLKPANVLLARTKSGLVPKVADFGIAKIVDSSGPINAGLTRTGTSLGSPAYMAPEQVRDARTVDPAADTWSLGALLYELLLHRRAFEGTDVLDMMNAVQHGRFTPPRDVRADLPERFVRTIEGCLKVDRDERFETCDEILASLDDGGGATQIGADRSITPREPVPRADAAPARPTAPASAGPDPKWLAVAGGLLLVAVLVAAAVVLAQ